MFHFLAEMEWIQRKDDIAVSMVTSGLEDIAVHFLPRRKAWERYLRLWFIFSQGREDRFHTDYWRWWGKEGIDLEGARAASGAAKAELGEKDEAEEVEERGRNGDRGGTLTQMGQSSS